MKGYLKTLENLEIYIEKKLKEWNIPGVALAIVKDSEIIFSDGFGLRNLKENLLVTENTIFPIGSATKTFTSMAAGILADEGKLDLDTPIKKYMPWFKMYDPYATEHVTARDMLCHRTGLPRHEAMWYKSSLSRKEIVERVQYLQPSKDFRSVFQYQNHMLVVIGQLIEELTGILWEEYICEKILVPLGMDSSSFSIKQVLQTNNHSVPYKLENGSVEEMPFLNVDSVGPAGSINSNLKDMVKWIILNLNNGIYLQKQIISKAKLTELHTPQITCRVPYSFKEAQLQSYGLGWQIEAYHGNKIIYHGGNTDGFAAQISIMPELNLGMVILTNLHGNLLTRSLEYYIYDCFLGCEDKDWSNIWMEKTTALRLMGEKMKSLLMPQQKEATSPSHNLGDYTGIYYNCGYGQLIIKKKENELKLIFNTIEAKIEHYHYNTFIYKPDNSSIFLVNFHLNNEGNIDNVSINMELDPAVKEIKFKKKRG